MRVPISQLFNSPFQIPTPYKALIPYYIDKPKLKSPNIFSITPPLTNFTRLSQDNNSCPHHLQDEKNAKGNEY